MVRDFEDQIVMDKEVVLNAQSRIELPEVFKAEIQHCLKHNIVAQKRIKNCGDPALIETMKKIDKYLNG